MAYVGPAKRRQGIYHHQHWEPAGYPFLRSRYQYLVKDVFVEGTLVETYQARTDVEREASYVFQVPPEASVVDFGAWVGSTRVHAVVAGKAEASKKYEAAKTAGVQAWTLDQVHEEYSVTYIYMLSTDTLENVARLSIPVGFEQRNGASPGVSRIPTAPTGGNAVSITVGVEVSEYDMIFDLDSPSHHASITGGWSDSSFKWLSLAAKSKTYRKWKAYVEFASDALLKHDFVLEWTVSRSDKPRCVAQKLAAPVRGQPETCALALTLVSNIDLHPVEHEYIFLVDCSHSMAGPRIKAANDIIKTILTQLPTRHQSSFNIYHYTRQAWSILPGRQSLVLAPSTISTIAPKLATTSTTTAAGTDISNAVTTALHRRDHSKARCSVIVLTGGLDRSVTHVLRTVQKQTARSHPPRVFVVGLGDAVSRGTCEALASAGAGATTYIAESRLQDRDYARCKAATLVTAMSRAPIRVRSINWGVSTVQQAPRPGSVHWAVRSRWYAIVGGDGRNLTATIRYDVLGSSGADAPRTVAVRPVFAGAGRHVHAVAARALISGLEKKLLAPGEPTDKARAEAEMVRLGKTYRLASAQTAFVAMMNGVGRMAYSAGGAARSQDGGIVFGEPFRSDRASLNSAAAEASPATAVAASKPSTFVAAFATQKQSRTQVFLTHAAAGASHPPMPTDTESARNSVVARIIGAQDGDGAFDAHTIAQVVFPGKGIPAAPACISSLAGRGHVKAQMWLVICVMAYLRKKAARWEKEWADAHDRANYFVKTTLCVLGVFPGRSGEIMTSSLASAARYFA